MERVRETSGKLGRATGRVFYRAETENDLVCLGSWETTAGTTPYTAQLDALVALRCLGKFQKAAHGGRYAYVVLEEIMGRRADLIARYPEAFPRRRAVVCPNPNEYFKGAY